MQTHFNPLTNELSHNEPISPVLSDDLVASLRMLSQGDMATFSAQKEVARRLLAGQSVVAAFANPLEIWDLHLPITRQLGGLTVCLGDCGLGASLKTGGFLADHSVAGLTRYQTAREKEYKVIDELKKQNVSVLHMPEQWLDFKPIGRVVASQSINLLIWYNAGKLAETHPCHGRNSLALARQIQRLGPTRLLALANGVSPQMARQVATRLCLRDEDIVRGEFLTSKVNLVVTAIKYDQAVDLLIEKIRKQAFEPTLVYAAADQIKKVIEALHQVGIECVGLMEI